MISANASDSFDRILQHAVRSRLVMVAADHCNVARVSTETMETDADIVTFTISGLAFRLLLLLHLPARAQTRQYFVRDTASVTPLEGFLEIGNLCCGAISQALSAHFPDLGMSTPYVLGAHCLSHVDALGPQMLATYAVVINDGVQVGVTLAVCANGPLDFQAEVAAETESGGELELF
ncbi:hypothetical protein [Cupriavidus pinatubonensis]|uniref:Chemotaxis phosphatase CheX-like domain-containing protein n=1 Tax=Cupriavidus pinatubonensis TaxID=248026 RepID=A0ABM8WI78_9BURK|nr:hypothetical protein [Cupriavidus pinatubonensis]CAG9167091.1 hypothetical protein LMG23994_01098 [Cupriavidus pinatubonensis]